MLWLLWVSVTVCHVHTPIHIVVVSPPLSRSLPPSLPLSAPHALAGEHYMVDDYSEKCYSERWQNYLPVVIISIIV